jgi:hypothetical protein
VPLAIFNPYIIAATSFPLDRGTLEFNGTWNVRKGIIRSVNHLVILDPRTTKRIKNRDAKKIPLPLIMSFIREKGNVIDYEIPVTGNLKNPKFHLHDVIFDLLRNIFVKPPAIPYILQVKNVESEIEKSVMLKWETLQDELLPDQKTFVSKMNKFLSGAPDAQISVYPQLFSEKEKEYLLFYEAKKKFFLFSRNKNQKAFSKEDSLTVSKMSIKDSSFVSYLKRQINGSLIFTVQERCSKIVDSSLINSRFEQLNKKRRLAFLSSFDQKGTADRVKILKSQNVIPYNGFSFYRIEYKGEYPEYLMKAYREMNQLNKEIPRKKFLQVRKSVSNNALK